MRCRIECKDCIFSQKKPKKFCGYKKTLYICKPKRTTVARELSSVGSERLPYKQRVGGSTPSAPTKKEVSNQADLFRYILPRLLFGSSEMRILSIERTQEGNDGIHLRTAQLFP